MVLKQVINFVGKTPRDFITINPILMNKYPQLDLARSLAALFVFFNHLRYLIFQGFHEQQVGVAGKIFFFLTGFGHQSVMIFFVLSGFFITKTIVDSIERKEWNVKRYAIQRLTRLWVVLIPALGLTFLVDSMAWNYFHFNDDTLTRSSLVNFLQNVFFLQIATGPTFGSNLALWSLGNEFWYYVLLPFILLPIFTKKNRVAMIGISVIALSLGIWFLNNLFVGTHGFVIFLMGSLVYMGTRKAQKTISNLYFFASLTCLITVLTLTRHFITPMEFWDLALGASFALLAYTWLRTENFLTDKYERFSVFVSKFSYTLYVVHVPLMLFFCAMFRLGAEYFSFSVMKYYCLLAAIILVLSWLFYWLFERNTIYVRRYFEKHFLK